MCVLSPRDTESVLTLYCLQEHWAFVSPTCFLVLRSLIYYAHHAGEGAFVLFPSVFPTVCDSPDALTPVPLFRACLAISFSVPLT